MRGTNERPRGTRFKRDLSGVLGTEAWGPEGSKPVVGKAGTPGSWKEANGTPPDLAAVAALGPAASPKKEWDKSRYAPTGDGTGVHWNGDEWLAGHAPDDKEGEVVGTATLA